MSIDAPSVLLRNNVRELGDPAGRPIVFAHGYGCSQAMWRDVVPHFLDGFRVVLFDHVGAGNSDTAAYDRGKYDSLHGYASDVLEIVHALDLRDVVMVGHSVSATISVLAANREPDRFGALVLVGPSPRYTDDDAGYRGGFTRADIDQLLETLDANHLGWSATMAPVIMGNPDRPALGQELTESFCRIAPEIASHFAHVTFLSDNRADLAEVTVPTLILQSADDVIAPDHVGVYVHEHIPGSTFVRIAASGHVANLSAPDEVAGAILTYLA